MWNLAIICHMTKLVRGLDLFLVWCHRLICIVLSLCKHACKEACDVNPGINPYPLLARSCDRWWPDFVTFTACKRSRFGLKWGKKAQCVSNRYIEDIKRWQEDMNFMFECQEQYLMSECSERVGYCSCHENIKFISSS